MTPTKSKRGRKKVKYKTITFKVTARQKKSLQNYARSRHTTPNKIIKKALKPLLENYVGLVVNQQQVSANQLQLF